MFRGAEAFTQLLESSFDTEPASDGEFLSSSEQSSAPTATPPRPPPGARDALLRGTLPRAAGKEENSVADGSDVPLEGMTLAEYVYRDELRKRISEAQHADKRHVVRTRQGPLVKGPGGVGWVIAGSR